MDSKSAMMQRKDRKGERSRRARIGDNLKRDAAEGVGKAEETNDGRGNKLEARLLLKLGGRSPYLDK